MGETGFFRRLISCLLWTLAIPLAQAEGVDWSRVQSTEVALFYPGQTSFEWINSRRQHDGARRFPQRSCRDCHEGDESIYGPYIVAGGENESAPLPGRNGYLTLQAQAAVEDDRLFMRLRWPRQPALQVRQDPDYSAKVTVMWDDGGVKDFSAGGCWALCHEDSREMPAAEGEGKTKYLRGLAMGTGESAEVFVEFWQARLKQGAVPQAIDGYIARGREPYPSTLVQVQARVEGGEWVVEFSRPLEAGPRRKALRPGGTYFFGIALHDQHVRGRYHLTSLEYRLELRKADAALEAVLH